MRLLITLSVCVFFHYLVRVCFTYQYAASVSLPLVVILRSLCCSYVLTLFLQSVYASRLLTSVPFHVVSVSLLSDLYAVSVFMLFIFILSFYDISVSFTYLYDVSGFVLSFPVFLLPFLCPCYVPSGAVVYLLENLRVGRVSLPQLSNPLAKETAPVVFVLIVHFYNLYMWDPLDR